MVSNEGAGTATNVIIVDKVPSNTTGLHVGRTAATVPHVTITAAGPTAAADWKAYWGSASASTHMTYGELTGWTTIELTSKAGTVDATAVYVKFEKASVAPVTEKAKTLTWGVTIK
jgi:hypothetical protein